MVTRSVDLRARVPSHVGDVQAYLHEVDVMRKAMTSDFCVAPGCVVPVRSGVATAGSPITPSSLPDGEGPAAWRLQELVRAGRVLQRY
jgi:hypothetical protein